MKIRKKASVLLTLAIAFSLVFAVFFNSVTSIKANETETSTTETSTTEISTTDNSTVESTQTFDPSSELTGLPETEDDLRAKDEITVDEMSAYMDGTAYQSPLARANGKITGGMTQAEYNAQYSALNQEQNDAWNAKYNFRPETNVVRVNDWTTFRAAFENNAVSKIIIEADIYYGTSIRISRTESIEIDGQGHLLEMRNGSLNVDGLTSLANFGKAFSDVPVFHMHDLQIANNTGYGAVEGNLSNAWAFVNGNGQRNSNRRLWNYRIGNIYTPYDASQTNNNQRVGGRLINAELSEISVWGYNTVVTGAENFYTGGMTFEPNSFYKGTNAEYDYSVIWFMDLPTAAQAVDATGTRTFDVGEGSFVYLNYTANGTNYPAVYENWDSMTIGKNATYNANMPGSAVYFNKDYATFTAEEGSTVNLLSRRGSQPTVRFQAVNSTSGGQSNPTNTKFEMKPKSNLFVVGSNSGGVISYGTLGTRATGVQFILDNPNTFDIRNTFNSTTTTNAFLADGTNNRGSHSFIIKDSDISIWNNSTNIDGSPTYDYQNVENFTVTNASSNGGVTSTDADLASQFIRPNFKRISGMNSDPELIWTPVTDADYSQRSQILLGYTAVGGSDPFDPNGDAYVKPVYADAVRKAYVDYTDTLGNTYTGVSGADNYVHWLKADHATAGFQIAGQDMKGTPYKASLVGGVLTPYRSGVETPTTVLDVTPPEPATLTGGRLTNATKQLKAENLEPNAKVLLSIDGAAAIAAGTVEADGTWTYNLSGYLATGQTVTIYLQDSAARIDAEIAAQLMVPTLPTTHTVDGNINPYPNSVTYSDATFQPAIRYTVEDVIPVPTLRKGVTSSAGDSVSVGDTVTYSLTATNTKAGSENWGNVVLEDTLPDGLDFDEANHGITITLYNASETPGTDPGTPITVDADSFEYNESTRLLTINVGNIPALNKVVATFDMKAVSASEDDILNKAFAKGDSPQEATFVEGGTVVGPFISLEAESNEIGLPGGELYGGLTFVSAPTTIDFGVQAVKTSVQR
ncbi:pectate lyase-like adhesive domain-containing protein, partial [Enterococcus larvae]